MKLKNIFTIVCTAFSVGVFAQNVGINTNTPNPKAALDIEATDKGILIPRMTTVQRNSLGVTLGTLHEALMVYDTDDSQFYYWDGTNWSGVGGGTNTDDQNLLGATLTGTVLQIDIEDGSPAVIDLAPIHEDADSDPTNEIELPLTAITGQILAWNGNAWVAQNPTSGADNWGNQVVQTSGANISGNGTTASPLVVTDNDGDPTNEIQDISLSGTNLSITNGSTIDLSSLQDGTGTDNQTLSITGNNLSISGGNSVVIPSGADNWGTQVVQTSGSNISGDGTSASPITFTEADGDPTNEIQNLTLTGSSLSISGGNSITLTDTDPTNEIELPTGGTSGQILSTDGSGNYTWINDNTGTDSQNLSITGNSLSISGGNTITIPSGADNWGTQVVQTSGSNISGDGTSASPITFTEADGDPTNEIQNLTLTGSSLSISGGNSITLTDTDPTNEIELPTGGTSGQILSTDGSGNYTWINDNTGTDSQNLSITGNSLSISGGNTITIPSGADNWGTQVVQTSGSNISGDGTSASPITFTEADGDPTNEIQSLTLTGSSLSISGGNSITLTDTDPTNEIQDISLTGTNLSITGGSTIDLQTVMGGGQWWQQYCQQHANSWSIWS